MATTLLAAGTIMLCLAFVSSVALVVANAKLAVEKDPRELAVAAILPQANCGGCGFPSCALYARAVASGAAAVNGCTVGGPPVAQQLASLMGVALVEDSPYRPVIHCSASVSQRLKRGKYIGAASCAAADVVAGVQGCTYGCLGFGDCVDACDYDAMEMVEGLPRIRYENCIGCGACVRACPRRIIEQIPFKVDRMLVVACANHDPGKAVREVCEVGCIGCGLCVRKVPELFSLHDNLAVIDYARYKGDEDLDSVREKCPTESLVVFGNPLPKHMEELHAVDAVSFAGPPAPPPRPTPADMHWRG